MTTVPDGKKYELPKYKHLDEDKRLSKFTKTTSTSKRTNVRAMDGQYYSKSRDKLKVIKTTVKNLNLEHVRPQRAGVIMYTVINGLVEFGMGLDSESHDLTDFGGSIRYKYDRNVVIGALREFEEETLGIFETITRTDVEQCLVLYDDYNLIIFIHMSVNPNNVCSAFNKKYTKVVEDGKNPEVCGITWLKWEEFQNSIKQKEIMFTRVQKFLERADDFSNLL